MLITLLLASRSDAAGEGTGPHKTSGAELCGVTLGQRAKNNDLRDLPCQGNPGPGSPGHRCVSRPTGRARLLRARLRRRRSTRARPAGRARSGSRRVRPVERHVGDEEKPGWPTVDAGHWTSVLVALRHARQEAGCRRTGGSPSARRRRRWMAGRRGAGRRRSGHRPDCAPLHRVRRRRLPGAPRGRAPRRALACRTRSRLQAATRCGGAARRRTLPADVGGVRGGARQGGSRAHARAAGRAVPAVLESGTPTRPPRPPARRRQRRARRRARSASGCGAWRTLSGSTTTSTRSGPRARFRSSCWSGPDGRCLVDPHP